MLLNDWQRIEKTAGWVGVSVHRFSVEIGLEGSQTLYQIKNGKHGISKELTESIVTKYPQLSRAWILTGEGNMFLREPDGLPILCFDMDAVYIAGLDKLPEPSYTVSLPRFRDASFAAAWPNKTMEPDIPAGATVVLAETTLDRLVPGYIYLIVSDRITTMRIVRREPDDDRLRLIAANGDFDELMVYAHEVRKIYVLKGYIHYNQ